MYCKKCGTQINDTETVCPNCKNSVLEPNFSGQIPQVPNNNAIYQKKSKPFYKKWWFWVIAVLAVIFIAAINSDETPKSTASNSLSSSVSSSPSVAEEPGTSTTETLNIKNNENVKEKVYKVGDVIKTDNLEITITKVEERQKVGSEFDTSNVSEGGTYICVQWKYKNVSKKPIGTFSQPSIVLNDKDGASYSSDFGATVSYCSEADTDRKVVSDLNPGITVKDAEVYEVSKDSYAAGGWKIKIKADSDIFVGIN